MIMEVKAKGPNQSLAVCKHLYLSMENLPPRNQRLYSAKYLIQVLTLQETFTYITPTNIIPMSTIKENNVL